MANNRITGVSRLEFNMLKEDVQELKKVYEIVNRQTVATEKLALEMKYMREDQDKAEKRIKVLEERPVKRFDNFIAQVVGCIISLILGFIAATIGIKN